MDLYASLGNEVSLPVAKSWQTHLSLSVDRGVPGAR